MVALERNLLLAMNFITADDERIPKLQIGKANTGCRNLESKKLYRHVHSERDCEPYFVTPNKVKLLNISNFDKTPKNAHSYYYSPHDRNRTF